MADTAALLRGLPEESPPPEIVLSAVRAFRYRAIAVMTSLVAGALILFFVLTSLSPENLGVRAESLRARGVTPLFVSAEVDGVEITLVELIMGEGEGYIHFVAEQHGQNVLVEVLYENVMTSPGDGFIFSTDSVGESFEVGALDQIGGNHYGGAPSAASGWIHFEGDHDPEGPLAVFFTLLFIPPEEIRSQSYGAVPVPMRIDYPGEEGS